MNRANIVYLFAVLSIFVSPSLTAPAETEIDNERVPSELEIPPNPSENEVAANLDHEVESIKPMSASGETTDVEGGQAPWTGISTGIIARSGINGTFECRKITCPDLTQLCKYTMKYSSNGKTANVTYQCFAEDNKVLLNETREEDVDGVGVISFDGFFSDFAQRMNSFLDEILKTFRY